MRLEDRREYFRSGLSSLYIPFYDALCEKLGQEWQPYSGLRDFDEQNKLWAKGRSIPPFGERFTVTNAKGGESAHNWGCGTDWTRWDLRGAPIWMKKDDPLWEEYGDAIQSVGLRWGKEFNDVDHNELKISCSWPHVLVVFNQNGMLSAQQKIQESMVDFSA